MLAKPEGATAGTSSLKKNTGSAEQDWQLRWQGLATNEARSLRRSPTCKFARSPIVPIPLTWIVVNGENNSQRCRVSSLVVVLGIGSRRGGRKCVPFVFGKASGCGTSRPTVSDANALRASPGVVAVLCNVLLHVKGANQSFRLLVNA